jgi:hypothetical protein
MRRIGICVPLAAALLLSLASGCASVTLTAANSVNPVLLGPVRSLGAKPAQGPPDYEDIYRFRFGTGKTKEARPYEVTKEYDKVAKFFYLRHRIEVGSAASMSASPSSAGSYAPKYDINSSSSSSIDNPVKTDVEVVSVTGGDPLRRVDVGSIECSGWIMNMWIGMVENLECKVMGMSPLGRKAP